MDKVGSEKLSDTFRNQWVYNSKRFVPTNQPYFVVLREHPIENGNAEKSVVLIIPHRQEGWPLHFFSLVESERPSKKEDKEVAVEA